MNPRRTVLWFGVKLVAIYGLLLCPWSAFEEAYSRQFAACANYLTFDLWKGRGLFNSDAGVQVHSHYETDPQHDIQVACANLKNIGQDGAIAISRTSSRHFGYMPVATVVALILATPIGWKRRLWALFWGITLANLFVLVRLAVLLACTFNCPVDGDVPSCYYHFSEIGTDAINVAANLAVKVPSTTYVVSLIIWALVTFRRSDLEVILGRAKGISRADQPPLGS
jgi:hypothetical protein